jgi:hypothetical protein
MAALLGQADDIQVVATADDPARALDRAPELGVDVTVVSPEGLDMGTAGWFESLADCRVVVLTDAIDELLVRAVSSSDVDACLQLASVTALELASTVRGVLQGQVTFSSDFLPRLVRRRQDDPLPAALTAREGDILARSPTVTPTTRSPTCSACPPAPCASTSARCSPSSVRPTGPPPRCSRSRSASSTRPTSRSTPADLPAPARPPLVPRRSSRPDDATAAPGAEPRPVSTMSKKMKRPEYERELRTLHGELVALQEWVKSSGPRSAWCSRAATPPARAARSRRSPRR